MICEFAGCEEDQKNVDWFCGFRLCKVHREELDKIVRKWVNDEER